MDVLKVIREDRVVAVVRADGVPDPAALADTLARSGIRAVELTFTIPEVARAIRAAASSSAMVGAETVLTAAQAEKGAGGGGAVPRSTDAGSRTVARRG